MSSSTGEDAQLTAKARQEALRFLSYRNRSQAEVRRKLSQRYPSEVVEQVIARLAEQGYLDDAAFAMEWRRQRERRRPRGQSMLQRELRGLGVDREVVRAALEGIEESDNAYRAANAIARRLASANSGTDASTDYGRFRQKVRAFLERRGFEHSAIRTTVERHWSELTNLLDGGEDAETQDQPTDWAEKRPHDYPGD